MLVATQKQVPRFARYRALARDDMPASLNKGRRREKKLPRGEGRRRAPMLLTAVLQEFLQHVRAWFHAAEGGGEGLRPPAQRAFPEDDPAADIDDRLKGSRVSRLHYRCDPWRAETSLRGRRAAANGFLSCWQRMT